jgi:hypothetical protein
MIRGRGYSTPRLASVATRLDRAKLAQSSSLRADEPPRRAARMSDPTPAKVRTLADAF